LRPTFREIAVRYPPTLASIVAGAALIAGGAVARVSAQPPAAQVQRTVRAWRGQHEAAIVRDFARLLAIPNVAADSAGLARNADTLVAWLARRGFAARRLEAAGPPAVFGELRTPGATRTVMFYAHYDGQPVDPAQWTSPPFTPVLRAGGPRATAPVIPLPDTGRLDPEARLFARSAGDDKAPIVALLAALDALRAARIPLTVNLKVFLEGEEEAGSPNLEAMLRRHQGALAADLWLFCDGPVHQSRRMQLAFGTRGVMGASLTVYGPLRTLHSGHYGNWSLNPAALLVDLLASMRAADGRITIAGFADDVRALTPAERDALARVPPVEPALLGEFALPRAEAADARVLDRTSLPSLNVDGLLAGRTGAGAGNAIPTEATAAVDFRLVPDQTPARVRELVEAHIRARGFAIVRDTPDSAQRRDAAGPLVRVRWSGGYPAARTPLDHPLAAAVTRIETQLFGDVVVIPLMGGSLPLYQFVEVLGAPFVIVPIANHDNNQHAADENLRLQNLWDGIELFAGLLARLGPELGNARP
jgi:acetylornithine deacetylase/succinyl-diaminopimelate desuccinylase-like protein